MSQDENDQTQVENEEVEATTIQNDVEETEVVDVKEVPVAPVAKAEERPMYTMPVAKAQEEKRKAVEKAQEEARAAAEAEKQAIRDEYEAKLRAHQPAGQIDSRLAKWAEDNGYDVDAAKSLVEVIKSEIPVTDTSKYDQILKDQEIQAHRAKVSQEFESKVAPLLFKDYPQATPEHVREVKQRIEELAFTEGFNTYRLEDIYQVKKSEFKFKNGYSAEPSGGRNADLVDFSNVSEEEELAMADKDPKTFAKFVAWQRGQGSKYID